MANILEANLTGAQITGRKLIGLFGGTFNPIHQGHLELAQAVLDSLHCEHIRFIPAAMPPHKSSPSVTAQHRAAMVALAIADNPHFVLDKIELNRTGLSYTIDTLISLRAQFPNDALCLIMGQDSYQQLPSWHRWQSLSVYAHLVVVHRAELASTLTLHPMHQDKLVPITKAANAFQQQPHGLITYLSHPPADVSSTQIRQQLSKSVTQTSRIPANVLNYIRKHHLYLV